MIMKLETHLAVKEAAIDGTMLVNPDQMEAFLGDIRDLAQEVFIVVTLNAKNLAIQRHLVSIGTVNSALVHPRECFRPAILDGASAVVLGHNHPSGDATPSADDIKITRQLIQAGRHLGIKVMDHIVIGNTALSLRETGLCEFN